MRFLDCVSSNSSLFSGCGGNFTAESGFLVSPFYPSQYPQARECSYIVSSPNGTYISIQTIAMDIDCLQSDELEIRDGASAKSPIIGTFCGNDSNVLPSLQTTQSHMWLRFTSSYLGRGKGFNISYEAVNYTNWSFNGGSCGGNFTSLNGILTSPSYPQSYHAAKNCVYIVTLPSDHYVTVRFYNMDIKCHSSNLETDNIEIRDGSTNASQIILRTCGNVSKTPSFIQTTQNTIWLR